ncbi:hypothetical protein MPTK1_8g08410 [Marchantia polymorpha subsp. ruderalis]|nr:hypothetical protein MARPO_0063s0077 [Marchantia polymorpha]BBN19167.1 hypothetical protein Mp_8g08410 [Marchantia polymorpha subsp. ruderalis]|eukprot:PTQ36545.1 hypothetical protein MARPO_0063s0077 [Marchantia polymorpha]
MDNVWERLAQLQVRQLGDIAHRRSFHKYNHRASTDSDFSDYSRDRRRNPFSLTHKNLLACPQPSVLDLLESTGEGQEPLVTEIWCHLPETLIEAILPHLPLHALLRFRAVCRKWQSMLYSPIFLSSWHQGRRFHHSESPWLIFRGSARECVAFNPSMDRWINIPLHFLPSPRVRVVATAGGLLCVRRRDDSLMVCNPFTKTYVHLTPKPWKCKYPIVGMVADKNPGEQDSYRVVVAGSHGSGVQATDLKTEVYDSNTKSWSQLRSRPLRHHFQTNAVYCNGFLYSAGFSVIMIYDVAKETWSEMRGPPVTQCSNLIMPQICECRGRLLMVEVVSERFVMRTVSIWEKDQRGVVGAEESDEWVKLDTMPDNLLGEVIAMSNSRLFSYFGHDDLLCFVIARREILAYSVSGRTWRWLPSCPFVQGFAQRFAAFPFHPRLDACV